MGESRLDIINFQHVGARKGLIVRAKKVKVQPLAGLPVKKMRWFTEGVSINSSIILH